jgi:hypothetical protein
MKKGIHGARMPKPFFEGLCSFSQKKKNYIYQEHGVEVDSHQLRKREAKHVGVEGIDLWI